MHGDSLLGGDKNSSRPTIQSYSTEMILYVVVFFALTNCDGVVKVAKEWNVKLEKVIDNKCNLLTQDNNKNDFDGK